ncbi:MAG: argininosuccinate lyase [Rhodospirillales bacterium]|nr:argininosuccinate lyase [Rhodospirillales bacterium]MSP80315.1 argininosuccinate lyase [Rhodospirillales bacterium]
MKSKVSAFLGETIDPILQARLFAPQIERELATGFPSLNDVNKAHVLMLVRRGILARPAARTLARAILALERQGPDGVPRDAAREDSYFNYEARIIEIAGPDAGGRMHIGRSRNDLKAAQERLRARALALEILDALARVRATMLGRARKFAATVMPGYTHLQPAQPVTFGWYLLGILHALERDHRRIAECYARINLNPLGAGALAGTSFPIDRDETRRLLGFDGLVPHALDAVASRDYLLELLGDCTSLATTWGRLAQDFFVMTSYEFATLELPDSVAGTSSMMPQKKNMVVLEDLKGSAAQLLGAYATAVAGVKGTNFTNTVDGNREAFRWCSDALAETIGGLRVLDVVVAKARPRPKRMRELVEANFSTATDLADALVQQSGLSFREAHHVVGGVVRAAMARGLKSDAVDLELVRAVARKIMGRPLDLSAKSLKAAMDPVLAAERRQGTGGPASADIKAMAATLSANLIRDRRELSLRQAKLIAAKRALERDFAALASGRSKRR